MSANMHAVERFVFHQVDRDPRNGHYGGNRILTQEHGDMNILDFDIHTRRVTAEDLDNSNNVLIFQLPQDLRSNHDLFASTILAQWERLRERFIGNEDYTDYLPALYLSLDDVASGKCIIIKDAQSLLAAAAA